MTTVLTDPMRGPMRARLTAALGRVRLAILGSILVPMLGALSACGGADTPAPRIPTDPTGPGEPAVIGEGSDTLPDAVVQASATAATETAAYEQALASLEAAIYGDHSWVQDLTLPVHDRDQDLFQREEVRGGIRVSIGLVRERAGALLQELARVSLPASVPAALADALSSPYGLHVEAMVCERRQALLGEECEAPAREEIAAAVEAVAREVRLRTRLTGGIPLDGASRPLRPIEIVVERASTRGATTALASVPVLIVQPERVDALDEDTEAVTDNAGTVRFALRDQATWPTGLRVSLDREAFLGPLAEMWPENSLVPIGRPVNARRWSLVVTERVQGNRARTAIFGASLDRAMRASGGEGMMALPPDVLRRVTAAAASTLGTVLPALADELQGKLDVLVVAEVDSEFASRMGDYRVWYEARGRVQVFDVWTGKRLTEAHGRGLGLGRGRRSRRPGRACAAGREARGRAGQGPAGRALSCGAPARHELLSRPRAAPTCGHGKRHGDGCLGGVPPPSVLVLRPRQPREHTDTPGENGCHPAPASSLRARRGPTPPSAAALTRSVPCISALARIGYVALTVTCSRRPLQGSGWLHRRMLISGGSRSEP